MYERWQRNLFPSASFDEFIAGVEAIGRTGEVKVGYPTYAWHRRFSSFLSCMTLETSKLYRFLEHFW